MKLLKSYLVFFLVVAFAVTCCMLLFTTTLADSMGLVFHEQNIATAAKLTLGNVFLITLIFAIIDYLRRKLLVDRPVQRITEATQQIMQGDFSVRLQPLRGAGVEGFNEIISAVNQMAAELGSIETLRTDFISNVSHELKTPLAVIGNYAELLGQPGLSEAEKQEYTAAISAAAKRLAHLITNILKLNKLENQQIFPKTETFDLSSQLCESLLQFEELWEKKNLTIEADIAEQIILRSDPELLSLVWNNLIANAVKFTPEGGALGLRLTAEPSQVHITVWDTGCGMNPEVGQHIFEKFYQRDTSHAAQGNGLGLALVKRVMDILQGSITVESTPGKGSAFTVTIGR